MGRTHTEFEPHFAFAKDSGSLARATERCVGVGACRKTTGGVMCPSYRATGDEQHSTRGRARLLWEMLVGDLRTEGFGSESVEEALDLCLSCKACKHECPVQVDMAQYKSEFLAQRYRGKPHPLHHYVFALRTSSQSGGSFAPALTNAILNGPLTSPLIKRIVGIAPERKLPSLAPRPYTHKLPFNGCDVPSVASEVLLWADTWNNYYHPQTLRAAETLLTEAGFFVQTPLNHICCGRPLYDFGLLGEAKEYLAHVLDQMAPQIDAGLPFIFLEPKLRQRLQGRVARALPQRPPAPSACAIKSGSSPTGLQPRPPDSVAGRLTGKRILIHGHCHHKAVFGGPASEIALLRRAGAEVEPIETTCCGMAGPFGFEANKYQVSKTIANLGLLPAIESAAPETIVVADGFSCREQIAQLGHREAMHFAEALVKAGKD